MTKVTGMRPSIVNNAEVSHPNFTQLLLLLMQWCIGLKPNSRSRCCSGQREAEKIGMKLSSFLRVMALQGFPLQIQTGLDKNE